MSLRLIAAIVIAGVLAFSHFFVYTKGRQHDQVARLKEQTEAAAEARRIETLRQSRADESATLARAREARIAADSAGVRSERDGLRSDLIAARRMAAQSHSAANQLAATCTELFEQSAGLLEEVSRAADQHSSDVKLLLDAWPK